MTDHRAFDERATSRPQGNGPSARFALWRPKSQPDIELQTGISIDTFTLPFHFHDSYQFDVVVEGARSYRLWRGVRTVAPFRLCVVNPGEGHAVRLEGRACSFRTMNVDPRKVVEACEQIAGRRKPPVFGFDIRDQETVRLFLAAHRAIECASDLGADCGIAEFLGNLVVRHAGNPGWPRGRACRIHLRRACDYVEAHLAESFSLETLAAASGISKYYLVRQFTRELGLPPHTYQLRLRIARARELLARAHEVKRVSAELGFADQSHFGRHFRRTTGLSPAEYQHHVTGRSKADITLRT